MPIATRPIPSTGELLPVIGLGTWQTFDVGTSPAEREPLRQVLAAFLGGGGRVIDSSPMYGRAEGVVGDLLAERGADAARTPPFLATKVWTTGRERGVEQMRASMRLMRRPHLDLLQVHNLVDWRTHLETLRAWKKQGLVRYIGVTHYQLGALGELERIVSKEGIDFVQLPYSIATRDAEQRLLPAAAQHRVAVLVMRPFEEGALFGRVRGKALARLGGRLRLRQLGAVLPQVHPRPPRGHLPHPRHRQPEAPRRQPRRRRRPLARRGDEAEDGRTFGSVTGGERARRHLDRWCGGYAGGGDVRRRLVRRQQPVPRVLPQGKHLPIGERHADPL